MALFLRSDSAPTPDTITASACCAISQAAECVVIADASLNGSTFTSLTLRGYPNLQFLTIGSFCCINVTTVNFSQLPSLYRLTIEASSFRSSEGTKASFYNCPKLDAIDYSQKLSAIFAQNDVKTVTLLRMEVPCCGGLEFEAKKAIAESGKKLSLRVVTISIEGEILADEA